MYSVEWDQWFFCGPEGDDSDYETQTRRFDWLCQAKRFVDELVEGKYNGAYDRKVHRDEVKLKCKHTL